MCDEPEAEAKRGSREVPDLGLNLPLNNIPREHVLDVVEEVTENINVAELGLERRLPVNLLQELVEGYSETTDHLGFLSIEPLEEGTNHVTDVEELDLVLHVRKKTVRDEPGI